jgi:uncharacterized protein
MRISLQQEQGSDNPSIPLGEEILSMNSQPTGRVGIPLRSLSRHVHITGTTGSGKSTTAKVLCAGLAHHRVPTVILDRTGEYADSSTDLAADAVVLKPGENLSIALFGLEEGADAPSQIVSWLSMLNHFYWVTYQQGLSPLQSRVFRTVLSDHYHGTRKVLTISDVILLMEALLKTKSLSGWPEAIEAAISRLSPLTVSRVGATFNRSYSTFKVGQLFEPKLTIIDLSVLPDDSGRNLLSQVVLKQVYEETRKRGKSSGDAISLAFLIDEAHHICPNRRDYISIPERCAIELRKYGFSLITCATRPILVSPNIIANSNTLISHMLNNSGDIEEAGSFFMGRPTISDSLRRLAVGEAMLQINSPKPLNPIRCRITPLSPGNRAGSEPLDSDAVVVE